jgi:phosphoglycolate phosphatase-like HAD superfamily hydrolase
MRARDGPGGAGYPARAAPGADEAVDEATSAGDVEQSKPAPDLVRAALDKAGPAPGEAMFAGDAVCDVQACRRPSLQDRAPGG